MGTSSVNIPTSNNSSRRSSLSSSRPEFRPVHPEIIRRNLVKDFLTSCSFKNKKPMSKYIRKMVEPSLTVADFDVFEEEDEIDKEITDMFGEKKRKKEKRTGVEAEMLFDIEL